MYCNKCGKPMKPHYTGICPTCSYQEYLKNTSFDEFQADLKRADKVRQKKNSSELAIVIIAGLLFSPLVWIVYFIYKNRHSIGKLAKSLSGNTISGQTNSGSVSGSNDSTSSYDNNSNDKETIITGPDGNIYSSKGAIFRDWAGNLIERGSPFRDSRGNWVQWGQAFYDNRDYYVAWGNPFYDAGDNYINPRG